MPVPPYRPLVLRLNESLSLGVSSSLYGSFSSRTIPRAAFSKIAFNGGPVSFGWLSNDFGDAGVVGDASRATASYGAALWEHSLDEAVTSLHEIARFDPVAAR